MPGSEHVGQLTRFEKVTDAGPPHLGSNFTAHAPVSSASGVSCGVLPVVIAGWFVAGSRNTTNHEPHGANSSGTTVRPSFSV